MTPLTLPRKPHPVESLEPAELAGLAEWCLENIQCFTTATAFDLIRNPRQFRDEHDAWVDWQRETDPYR